MAAMKRLIPLAAALSLAACGSQSPQGPSRADVRDAALKFARCMREHGIDMPDPKVSGDGATVFGQGPGPGGPRLSPQKQRAAQEACQHFMSAVRGPKPSAADQKKFRDAALANARCMRAHGVDFPDPQFGPDGEASVRIGPGHGIDPRSPAFQRAQKACASTLPGRVQVGP